jgi:hypothetical protein
MTSARHLDPRSIRLNKLNLLDKGISPGYIAMIGIM